MKPAAKTTLLVRMLPRAVAKALPHWQSHAVSFALTTRDGRCQRSGVAPLQDLGPQISHAQQIVLLLAASDVTLLRIAVPPLSASRLQAALPALVEEKLITDPDECALVAGPESDGFRTIAVVERDWLQTVVDSLSALGARRIVVLPLQLCLPLSSGEGVVAAAVTEAPDQIDLAVRFSELEGMGLPILPTQLDASAHEVGQALLALVNQHPFELSVPVGRLEAYADAVQALNCHDRAITVREENWQQWIEGARHQSMDLARGLDYRQSSALDWTRWRWPLALVALLLVVHVSALNWDWWRMRNEASDLRAGLTRTYREAFPNESVIVDPLAQMTQKINQSRRGTGGAAASDFVALASTFGEAWSALPAESPTGATTNTKTNATVSTPPASNPIAALDYRKGLMTVRFKLGVNPPKDAAQIELAARNASLTVLPEQDGAVAWQIRSAQ